MALQEGFRRLRLAGLVSLAVGIVLVAVMLFMQIFNYSPDDAVAPVFAYFWPLGLLLILVGVAVWLGCWVAEGFTRGQS